MLGDFCSQVAEHGTVASAFDDVVRRLGTANIDHATLRMVVDSHTGELKLLSWTHENKTYELFEVVAKVSQNNTTRSRLLGERIDALEVSRLRLGSDIFGPAPAAVPTMTTSATANPVSMGSVFESVEVEGSMTDVTPVWICAELAAIKSQQALHSERSKGQSVSLAHFSFACEADFGAWYTGQNPSGNGWAGFTDFNRIWALGTIDQVTSEAWLQTLHRSKAVGHKNIFKSQLASYFENGYPPAFVSNTASILSTTTIQCFTTYDAWRGNGIGDGNKERLLEVLHGAMAIHARYCQDNIPAGPLCELALKTAEVMHTFVHTLFARSY